ncbi:MAG: leucyl/phenylalanyl-tRNA--protein transferase [Myxococcota bacterium]|nr:leucyl/phenylalanyl-tRNA--protein transferase [Myxococcota bacterium]MEE2779078.1 leucyl/phenylalanyl-tRNA--protein transferase [Myxococcota bacterium]
MPIYQLSDPILFPPVEHADFRGILAVGGDLSPERLIAAYERGIFPWYDDHLPILWHAPDPRMVLRAEDLHVGRSLRKVLRQCPLEVRLDSAFSQVISRCASASRPDQDGTWITGEMEDAYIELHRRGFAHSAETWEGERLVGGLYGVSLGGVFYGESMFADEADASKIAFVTLVLQLQRWGINLIDCQIHTDHLERFGATEVPRAHFMGALSDALGQRETLLGPWTLDGDLQPKAHWGAP